MKRFLCVLTLFAFGAAPALADPKSDLMAAFVQMSKATSYHLSFLAKSGRSMEADMVMPGKMHMTSAQFEMIKIDTTTWIKMGGKWQQLSMPGMDQVVNGVISQAVAAAHSSPDDIVVTDLGMKTPLTGGPALHAYSLVNKAGRSPATVFLEGGVVVEMDSDDGNSARFSKFNAPIDIEPPSM